MTTRIYCRFAIVSTNANRYLSQSLTVACLIFDSSSTPNLSLATGPVLSHDLFYIWPSTEYRDSLTSAGFRLRRLSKIGIRLAFLYTWLEKHTNFKNVTRAINYKWIFSVCWDSNRLEINVFWKQTDASSFHTPSGSIRCKKIIKAQRLYILRLAVLGEFLKYNSKLFYFHMFMLQYRLENMYWFYIDSFNFFLNFLLLIIFTSVYLILSFASSSNIVGCFISEYSCFNIDSLSISIKFYFRFQNFWILLLTIFFTFSFISDLFQLPYYFNIYDYYFHQFK